MNLAPWSKKNEKRKKKGTRKNEIKKNERERFKLA
jgi:hypothetical protein